MEETIGGNNTINGNDAISGNGDALENTNGHVNGTNEKKEAQPPTDFKIAEIWIRDGQIVLDASESFWSDKVRAIGVMELCKDIVKNAKLPEPEKKKIVTPHPGLNMKDFVEQLRKKK